MNTTSLHSTDIELRDLLFGDEHEAAFQSTLGHVESCEICQARLDTLAGPNRFDFETQEMLSGFFEQTSDYQPEPFGSGWHAAADRHAAELGRLAPASHPEMLGRIGRYEIEAIIGAGGMGIVYKGFDTELNRTVALKVLAQHLSHSGAARQRFAREAKAAAGVVHEHVVAIHNVETDGEALFLVMPFVAGESLQARVDRHGALDPQAILRIAMQAAAGLQAAHEQGIVHRDVKPGNILLEGGVDRALVADFGLAQTVDDASLTQTGVIAGTPNYMSPEQALGQPTDPRSDLFSLGCVLYFMATGRPPFRAEKAIGVLHRVCKEPHTPVWQHRSDIPDDLTYIIDRLLKKRPSQRFASARQLHQELQNAIARSKRPPAVRWKSIQRMVRRNLKGSVRAAGLVAIGVLAAGLAWVAIQQYQHLPKTAVSSENGDRAVGDLVETAPRSFSVETWQQASHAERGQWLQSIHQLQSALDEMESKHGTRVKIDPWQQQLDSTHSQIDQIYRNTITK